MLPAGPHHEYVDRLASPVAPKGRGAAINPGNRFEGGGNGMGDGGPKTRRLHVLGDYLDEVLAEDPDAPGTFIKTQVYADRTRTLINHVDSPDLSFSWTINPYRGCEHGCIYCYARPGHEYLGLSCGVDFESKIMAKYDGPRLMRAELSKPSWNGETIVMSGVTDPYQPVEAKLRITRGIVEVAAEFAQPLAFITKNKLVLRDLDLLTELAKYNAVGVAVSLTSLDNKLAAKMEPRASAPQERLETIRKLSAAGIPVTVMTAPMVPGINDMELPSLLEAAAAAGATRAGFVMLRLPNQIKALFLEWLERHFPDRAEKVEHFVREMHGGRLYDSSSFTRQRGTGERAKQMSRTFKVFAKRYGLNQSRAAGSHAAGVEPNAEFLRRKALRQTAGAPGQGVLFE